MNNNVLTHDIQVLKSAALAQTTEGVVAEITEARDGMQKARPVARIVRTNDSLALQYYIARQWKNTGVFNFPEGANATTIKAAIMDIVENEEFDHVHRVSYVEGFWN